MTIAEFKVWFDAATANVDPNMPILCAFTDPGDEPFFMEYRSGDVENVRLHGKRPLSAGGYCVIDNRPRATSGRFQAFVIG